MVSWWLEEEEEEEEEVDRSQTISVANLASLPRPGRITTFPGLLSLFQLKYGLPFLAVPAGGPCRYSARRATGPQRHVRSAQQVVLYRLR